MKATLNIFFWVIFFICSCTFDSKETKPDLKQDSLVEPFLNLFESIDVDTFIVKSGEDPTQIPEFTGVEIDPTYYSFIRHEDTSYATRGGYKFYGCYKFDITKNIIGLVMRTPAEYWENSIKLFLFDKQKSRTVDHLEIAQSFGDAGDSQNKYSLIYKDGKKYRITLFQGTCWSLDEEFKTFDCKDSTFEFEVLNNIKLTAKSRTDTTGH